jgi:uncharacterized membrane protein
MQIIADLWWLWLIGSIVSFIAVFLSWCTIDIGDSRIEFIATIVGLLSYGASIIMPVIFLFSVVLNIIIFIKA